jgi:hypothetical protein
MQTPKTRVKRLAKVEAARNVRDSGSDSAQASAGSSFARSSANRLLVLSTLVTICAGYANMAVMPLWTESLIRSGTETETPVFLCCSIELLGRSIASILYSRLALSYRCVSFRPRRGRS